MEAKTGKETPAAVKAGNGKPKEKKKDYVEDNSNIFVDSQHTNINLNCALNNLINIGPDYSDVIMFAYYLYRRNLISARIKADNILFSEDIYFCNAAKRKIYDYEKTSLLEKLYIRSLFPNDAANNLSQIPKEYCENLIACSVVDECVNCAGKDKNASFKYCPYIIAAIVIAYSKVNQQDPDSVFRMLLGEKRVPFDNEKHEIFININPEDIKNIDSKSAYGAYLLMRDGFIRSNVIGDDIYYNCIRLCDSGDKSPKLKKIINFWRSKSRHERTLKKEDCHLKIDEETCKICTYNQCPERLAAYFDYLAIEYNCDPIDLAYFVAKKSTYCNLSFCDDYQYNRYSSHIMKSTLADEDKEDCYKRLNYITSKQAASDNSTIRRPVLPVNIAARCKDYDAAKDLIEKVFHQSMWYNDYYECGKENYSIKEYDISEKITDDIINLYESEKSGTIIILTNIADANISNCPALIKAITARETEIATFLVDENQAVDNFFSRYPKLKTKIFSKAYTFNDLSSKTVFDEVLSKIEETLDVSEEMQICLERYINATYQKSGKESSVYIKEMYENLIFRHFSSSINASDSLEASDIPSLKPKRTKEEIFRELDDLTGLENVKQKLKEIASLVEFEMKLNKNAKGHQSMHMIFNGNPGTGKTTVARLTAEILFSVGFIQENKLVQCSAKDLIGEYLGQTGPKTAQKCEEAYNGVLFIDEAYQLNPYTGVQADQYKEECVAELIQQMENNREKLVVIFAGYTDEMNAFLEKANTGLKSRLQQTVEFADYSVNELTEIFLKICQKEHIQLTDTAIEKIKMIFSNAIANHGDKFGNARYARNVFDKSYRIHAVNCSNIENTEENREKLTTLTADEIMPV